MIDGWLLAVQAVQPARTGSGQELVDQVHPGRDNGRRLLSVWLLSVWLLSVWLLSVQLLSKHIRTRIGYELPVGVNLRQARLKLTWLRKLAGLRQRRLRIIGVAGGTGLIAGPDSVGKIHALGRVHLSSTDLLTFRNEVLGRGLLVIRLLLVDERIEEHAAGADVNEAPLVLPRDRVGVTAAQKTKILRTVQSVEIGWKAVEFPDVKRDRA